MSNQTKQILDSIKGLSDLAASKFEIINSEIQNLNEKVTKLEEMYKNVNRGNNISTSFQSSGLNDAWNQFGGSVDEEVLDEEYSVDELGMDDDVSRRMNVQTVLVNSEEASTGSVGDWGDSCMRVVAGPNGRVFNQKTDQTTQFKVTLLGNGGVGKSYFVKNLRNDVKDDSRYLATVGVEVRPVKFHCNDGKDYVLNFWDTAGQERFGGLRDGYYIQSQAGIFFCDPSDTKSIQSMDSFIKDYIRVVEKDNVFAIVKAIMRNKTTVPDQIRFVKNTRDDNEKEEGDDDVEESPQQEFEKVIKKWEKIVGGEISWFEIDLDNFTESSFDVCLFVLQKLTSNDSLEFVQK